MIRFFRSTFAVAVIAAGLVAAPAAAGGNTITDIVAESGGEFDDNPFDYDILLNAVLTAGLEGALADESADLTVFAPNDWAFMRLANDLGCNCRSEGAAWSYLVDVLTDLGEGDPIPVLTDVLTYHVAPQSLTFFDVVIYSIFGMQIDTLQGATITPFFLTLIDNEPDLANPFLFFPFNVEASNGIIHTITRVMLPVDLP